MARLIFDLAPAEIDLRRCLASGQVFRFRESEGGVWEGADGPFRYRFSWEGGLCVDTEAPRSHVAHLLSLDQPLSQVRAELIRRGPELVPILEAVPGLRLLRPAHFDETVYCFLCSANNHLARIGQMIRELEALDFAPAGVPESYWRGRGFGYRGAWIPAVANQLAERGPEWPAQLRTMPYGELRRELMQLTGVGPKLADCIALYGLHRWDATPIDTHLWQALGRVYFPEWQGLSLTENRYRTAHSFLNDRFGDLAAYAHLYLYHENQLNARSRKHAKIVKKERKSKQ